MFILPKKDKSWSFNHPDFAGNTQIRLDIPYNQSVLLLVSANSTSEFAIQRILLSWSAVIKKGESEWILHKSFWMTYT